MPREARDSVVVITGASSGIGRATALAFARRGAAVVVAARRAGALENVAAACRAVGGQALVVPTDVTDEDAVRALARHTIESFGRIDVWVNNAAVTLFARFEEAPIEAVRRVLDTDILGYVHGARAALPYFREQGDGVLINNASGVGKAGIPYVSAYVMAKFAVVGLGESLREELRGTGIHVCTLLPGSTDTPILRQAANYTGREIKPLDPIDPPERVAETIVALAERPARERFVSPVGRWIAGLHTLAPALYERLAARVVDRDHFGAAGAPRTDGNLFRAQPWWTTTSGGWLPGARRRRLPLVAAAAAALLVPVIVYAMRPRSGGRPSRLALVLLDGARRPRRAQAGRRRTAGGATRMVNTLRRVVRAPMVRVLLPRSGAQ